MNRRYDGACFANGVGFHKLGAESGSAREIIDVDFEKVFQRFVRNMRITFLIFLIQV